MKCTKKIAVLSFSLLLSLGFTSITSAANCTSWETYSTGPSYCTTAWCNPLTPWFGKEERAAEYQSRICNIDGGDYVVEYRTILARQSCDC